MTSSATITTAAAPQSPPRSLTSPRFLRLLLAQSAFSLGWSVFLLAPKFFTTELHADAAQIGHISAMGGISSVVGIPIAVRALDWGKRKQLFFLGTASLAVLSTGYLFVDRLGPLCFVLQAMVGLSFVFTFNAIATMAADEAPPAKLGQALGLLGASNMVMNAVATIAAEHLSLTLGWNAAFMLGLFGSAAATLTLFTFQEHPVERPANELDSNTSIHFSIRPLIAPLVACGLAGVTFIAMFVFYQPYAIELGAKELRNFFIGFTGSAIFMRVLFGSLGDRFGYRRVSLLAALLYGVACAAMFDLNIEFLWAYGALLGVAHGVLYPTLNAYVVELAPAAMRGRVMTYYNGTFAIGTGIAGFAWGPLAKAQGYPTIYIYGAALALIASILLALSPKRRPA